MNKKPKVSIVIPIYNVENYLLECVNSVCNQTLQDIEIICVDDGSTDNSVEIVKNLQKKDKRIKCITKANSGYGNTINVGFDNATGEYFGIVESDDCIKPSMFEDLYNVAKVNDLDVVKSDYLTFTTKKGKRKCEYQNTCTDVKYYNEVLDPKDNKEVFSFHMNTWTGIYKMDFLLENNIRHNETPGASYQDNGFWFQTISLAKRLMFLHNAYYYYRQDNPNSSINSKGKVFCMNEEYAFIYNFIDSHEEVKKEFINQYFTKKFFNYLYTYNRIATEYKLIFLKRVSEELKEDISIRKIDVLNFPNDWIRDMAVRIMDNYEKFYYDDAIYQLKERLKNAYDRLHKVKTCKEHIVGMRVVGKIKKIINVGNANE